MCHLRKVSNKTFMPLVSISSLLECSCNDIMQMCCEYTLFIALL